MEEVEEQDLAHYLRLAEQFKPVLGPGHYQLVMIRQSGALLLVGINQDTEL